MHISGYRPAEVCVRASLTKQVIMKFANVCTTMPTRLIVTFRILVWLRAGI